MDLKQFFLCLLVCFGLSFLIGIERQYRRRIIGLRTIILVSVGSFLYVSVSFFVGETDLTRIAAQVVSGIGFLGAGVIIKDGLKVSGLTTAATMWCCGAIGVLCAVGALSQAIAGTVIILFSNIILRYINRLVNNISYNLHTIEKYDIIITMKEDLTINIKKFINNFVSKNSRLNIDITSFSISNKKNVYGLNVSLSIRKTYHNHIEKLIEKICENFNVESIELKKIVEGNGEDEEEL